MLRFSILSAFRRKTVAVLAIVGVGLGSGLLVALLSLSEGAEARFNRTFKSLSGIITATSENASIIGRFLGVTGDPLPSSYVAEIAEISGVEKVAPYFAAPLRSEKFGPFGAIGVGITGVEVGDEDLFENPNQKITEGRSFQAEGEIIAGVELFNFSKLSDVDLAVGDKIEVAVGATKETLELALVGVFETGSATTDRGLFGSPSLVKKLSQIEEGKVSGILVRVSDPTLAKAVAEEIEALFEENDSPVSAYVAGDVFEGLSSFLDVFNIFLLGIALISAAAGGTAVMVVMLLTVFERRKEFGILKAGGWSNANIIFSVLFTSLTLSFLGVVLGLSMGSAGALALERAAGIDLVSFTFSMFAWAGGVGFVTGLIGGILPALSAARVSPIETLRGE